MTYRWYILAALIAVVGVLPLRAQTDMQYSQYYEVQNLYNPGAIGTSDLLRIRAGSRMQWVGIDNAPKSFVGAADMPLKLGSKRIGVGLVTETESYGLYSSLQLGAQAAYKFNKFGGQFSVGFQIGMYDQKFKGSDVYIPDDDDYHESTDDAIPMQDIHGMALDLGLGLTYTHRLFYAGISCTHINSPTIKMKSDATESTTADQDYEFQANRTLYFTAGGNIPIKNTLFELLPSVLVKSDFTFTTGEGTIRARYNKMFSAGIGYRWDDAVYLTLGAEIKNFYLGYSYDYSTSAIAKASSGSHEFWIGYSMKLDLSDKNKNKHKSIRIM
ncbi:MAG: PorP/SprF family type IX secretion system membrane protein [Bacteroidales bacterium]|nr:PorP/SprF family type IX secretion system membrane protein [Bacteroidales bacterium]